MNRQQFLKTILTSAAVRVASLGIERRSAIEVPERGVARYFVAIE